MNDLTFPGNAASGLVQVAIIATQLGSTNTSTDATSFQCILTNAPGSNTLVLVALMESAAAVVLPNSITITNLTLVEILHSNYSTLGVPTMQVTVYRGMTNITPGTVVTADFGIVSQTGCRMCVMQFTNVDTSGADGAGAIVQSVGNGTDTSAVNFAITLASISGAGKNAVFGAIGRAVNAINTATLGSGWIRDFDGGNNGPTAGLTVEHILASTDNFVTVTNGSFSGVHGGIALEIKAAP